MADRPESLAVSVTSVCHTFRQLFTMLFLCDSSLFTKNGHLSLGSLSNGHNLVADGFSVLAAAQLSSVVFEELQPVQYILLGSFN